jgi:hypothetical protein
MKMIWPPQSEQDYEGGSATLEIKKHLGGGGGGLNAKRIAAPLAMGMVYSLLFLWLWGWLGPPLVFLNFIF